MLVRAELGSRGVIWTSGTRTIFLGCFGYLIHHHIIRNNQFFKILIEKS